jgi:hypothetical protein
MAGGLTSSFFSQMRCRKSPSRVFGCSESIGTVFKAFGDFILQVLSTFEVSESSRELRATIEGGHA